MPYAMEARGFTNDIVHPGERRFPGSGRPEFGQGSANAFSTKWSALHEAAETVALIAGVPGDGMTSEARMFAASMREAPAPLRERAKQGIADIAAILEPGLSALLATHARGGNPAVAANTLLREFLAARDRVMALTPPSMAPPRFSA